MRQTREKAAFAFESLLSCASEKCKVQKFHRCAPFEATIAPSGHPDRAHSSVADRRLQRVGAKCLSSQWRRAGECRLTLQESLVTERVVFPEQRLQIHGERWILLTD